MHEIINVLGNHLLVGVLVAIVAGAALLLWQYLRRARGSARFRYLTLVQGVAMGCTVLSLILIVSRFLAVEGL